MLAFCLAELNSANREGNNQVKKIINLDGVWNLRKISDSVFIPANVPGYVVSALQANGMIEDIYEDLNAALCENLEENDYEYVYEFNYQKSGSKMIELVFEGIDTIGSIYLNGRLLGMTANMFLPYRYDVTDCMLEGNNTIRILFPSQTAVAKRLYNESKHKYAAVYDLPRIFLRKAQYQFGWDWCPRVVCAGIWRSVKIEETDGIRLYSPSLSKLDIIEGYAHISTIIYGVSKKDMQYRIEVSASFDGLNICNNMDEIMVSAGNNTIETELLIPDPHLWYPVGLGNPDLYDFEIRISELDGEIVDIVHFKSGLRKVNLIMNKDITGESFIFEINGKKLFAKGANYIPTEMLPTERKTDDVRTLVKLARQANMNMLRIWGGGYYECHEFYDECDKQGILIWQDFMFACGEYPDEYEDFRNLVQSEAEHVVKDLSCHPSIVLWCGSNENVWALHDWWKNDITEFLGRAIYQQILPEAVESFGKLAFYWESSPFGGEAPNCMNIGDTHFWDVWAEWKDISEYTNITPRFCSEFGMQSMPTIKTTNQHLSKDKHLIPSMEVLSRNCQTYGPERTMRYIFALYGIPKGYEEYIILSQLSQNDAMRLAVENWRVRKYLISGVLFWQFNDCWPGASQACVDYYLRKKAVFFGARKFYNEVISVCSFLNNGIGIKVVNDRQTDVAGKITLESYQTNGKLLGRCSLDFICPPDSVIEAGHVLNQQLGIDSETMEYMPKNISGNTTYKKQPRSMREIVIFVSLEYDGMKIETTITHERPRYLPLMSADIRIGYEENRITLFSEYPVLGVWIETENDVDLSDNGFDMKPGIEYIIDTESNPGKIIVRHIAQMIQYLK